MNFFIVLFVIYELRKIKYQLKFILQRYIELKAFHLALFIVYVIFIMYFNFIYSGVFLMYLISFYN